MAWLRVEALYRAALRSTAPDCSSFQSQVLENGPVLAGVARRLRLMTVKTNLKVVSDDELLRGLFEVLKDSRRAEADLIARIAEVDARRLYAREAASSMFAYCTEVLHLSEPETALRIRVARVSRKHPVVLAMLRDGRIHLSGVALLAPVLTRANQGALLRRATHKSKRQIEELIAEVAPRPDVAGTVRKLPGRRHEASAAVASPGASSISAPNGAGGASEDRAAEQRPDAVAPASDCSVGTSRPQPCPDPAAEAKAGAGASPLASPPTAHPTRPVTVEPLSPGRYGIRFTASTELHDKLERLRALMRHSVPDGDLATIIDVAVTRELERLEAKRFGKTKAPRKGLADTDTTPRTRDIPAAVRRSVHERDDGRCTYRNKQGKRCSKRHDVEFHHKKPFGRGGPHSPEVVTLHCKAHNALMAEHDYGREKMARFRRSVNRVSEGRAVYGANPGPATAKLPVTRRRQSTAARVRGPAPPP